MSSRQARQGAIVPLRAEDVHLSSINAAATLTLWALLEVEAPSIACATVRDPERNVPRATLVGTALVGLLYILSSTPIAMFLPAAS